MRQDTVTDVDGEGEPIQVLVVDDDPEIAELVRFYLERIDEAFSVTVATSAPAGLEKVRERGFDAVVSDYHMPAMDGLTFLDRLSDAESAPPGIIFSSDDASEIVQGAREANVPYVQKRMHRERFDRLASYVRAAVRDRQG